MSDQAQVVFVPATTSVNTARAINSANQRGTVSNGKSKRQKKNDSKKKKKGKKGDNLPFVKDVQTTIESSFGDSNKLIWIVIAVAVIFSHQQSVTDGFLGDYVSNDNVLGKWIVTNTQKTLGLVCFAPVVMMAKEELRMKVFMAVVAGALASPALTLATYAMIAVATHVALNVKSKTNRLYILFACAFMAYFRIDVSRIVGRLSSDDHHSPVISSPHSSTHHRVNASD